MSNIPNITVNMSEQKWQDKYPNINIAEKLKKVAIEAFNAGSYNLPCLSNVANILINIELSNDKIVHKLNLQYRGKDRPTNVLSFPQIDITTKIYNFDIPVILGDIIVSFETTNKEAEEFNKNFLEYSSHLVIHGVLHLLCFDHIEDADAEKMEKLESDIMKNLGYNDPYW